MATPASPILMIVRRVLRLVQRSQRGARRGPRT